MASRGWKGLIIHIILYTAYRLVKLILWPEVTHFVKRLQEIGNYTKNKRES